MLMLSSFSFIHGGSIIILPPSYCCYHRQSQRIAGSRFAAWIRKQLRDAVTLNFLVMVVSHESCCWCCWSIQEMGDMSILVHSYSEGETILVLENLLSHLCTSSKVTWWGGPVSFFSETSREYKWWWWWQVDVSVSYWSSMYSFRAKLIM
jgi:hypothetical protein